MSGSRIKELRCAAPGKPAAAPSLTRLPAPAFGNCRRWPENRQLAAPPKNTAKQFLCSIPADDRFFVPTCTLQTGARNGGQMRPLGRDRSHAQYFRLRKCEHGEDPPFYRSEHDGSLIAVGEIRPSPEELEGLLETQTRATPAFPPPAPCGARCGPASTRCACRKPARRWLSVQG